MLFTYSAYSSENLSWASNSGIIRAKNEDDARAKVLKYLKNSDRFYDYGSIRIKLQIVNDFTDFLEIDNNGY